MLMMCTMYIQYSCTHQVVKDVYMHSRTQLFLFKCHFIVCSEGRYCNVEEIRQGQTPRRAGSTIS